MTGLEALQSVQYVSVGDERFAVVDLKDWKPYQWLETVEDVQIARTPVAELDASGGR